MRRASTLVTALGLSLSAVLLVAPVASAVPGDGTTFDNSQDALGAPLGTLPVAAPAPAAAPAAAVTAVSASDSPELALAKGNKESTDLLGWEPSLYQGKWFDAGVESIRKCIMDRESNFSYTAVGAGTYFGAYQLNRGLALGALTAMEGDVRKDLGAAGVAILKSLRDLPPSKWNRYWQDRAFYSIWHGGDGKGHWRGGGLNCF